MFEDAIDKAKLYEFIPQHLGEFPEGFDVIDHVKETLKELEHESVLDFGCGSGRLSPGFCPKKYVGIDHNHKMFETAKKRFERHVFEHADTQSFPSTELFFSYMTLCHLSEEKLQNLLDRIESKTVVVMEIMGRAWRYQDCIGKYAREQSEYLELFRSHDYVLHKKEARPFARYQKSPSYENLDTNLITLVFKKIQTPYHKDVRPYIP